MNLPTTITVKITHEDTDEIRRFQLPRESATFSMVLTKIQVFWGSESLVLRYRDEENDLVTLSTDEELADAMNAIGQDSKSPFRLFAKKPADKKPAPADKDKAPAPADKDPSAELEAALAALMQGFPIQGLPAALEHLPMMFQAMCSTAGTEPRGQGSWRCGGRSGGGAAAMDSTTVSALQTFLKKQAAAGDVGPVDGCFGGRTARALQLFLQDAGYDPHGADGCFGPRSTRALQAMLQDAGHQPCGVDGRWGGRTTRAVQRWLGTAGPEVHHGVSCDKSGMCPIVGTRYKMRGTNYDLCQAEYDKLAPEEQATFVAIERPSGWRCGGRPCGQMRPPQGGGCGGGGGRPQAPSKAEQPTSRFVHDVSIFDGTEVAPNTAFTKIWRLRNTGSVAWPAGAQLLFVGGDQMSSDLTTPLPGNGAVPAGAEVDVAVQLAAPSEPGRYVGYWRLAGPAGRRFGQRVWAHIQVVDTSLPAQAPSAEEEAAAAAAVLHEGEETDRDHEAASAAAAAAAAAAATAEAEANCGSPPISVCIADPFLEEALLLSLEEVAQAQQAAEAADSARAAPKEAAAPPATDAAALTAAAAAAAAAEKRAAGKQPSSVQTPPLVEPAVATARSTDSAAAEPAAVTARPADLAVESDALAAKEAAPGASGLSPVEAALAAMGFDNAELNACALQLHGQQLEPSAAALANLTSDWAESLDDLAEMGFADALTNQKLLLKHNGSLKQAVKELVQATR